MNKMSNEIASYKASFLNDLMIDNTNGFIYIADSGIFTDPLEGGIIVFNMKTHEYRRVLDHHVSVQDVPGYWFEIAGKKIWKDRPMRTGPDGIALSADRTTLYWSALTARHMYGIDTSLFGITAFPILKSKKLLKTLVTKARIPTGCAPTIKA